jgi:predicted O-linked N-acetylglucosamine transferase (SPINDLY family)
LLLTFNYDPATSAQECFEEHCRWGDRLLASVPPLAPPVHSPGRRLRVGYVSSDFWQHPVVSFIEPVLAAHDRERFEIFCYADVLRPDAVTARLQSLDVTWRDIRGISDAAAVDIIRRDSVDILVDLGGHTDRSRMALFARKPAPVQFTYLGYPNTTGLRSIDYRLTDAIADPLGASDALHVEKLVRLPSGFLQYRPPADSPEPTIGNSGGITFASFNNLAKLTPQAIELWSNVLRAVPGSTLLMKNMSLCDAGVADMIAGKFARHGIERGRLQLRAILPTLWDHLKLYNSADIALDTFPYNGTTTTCEALWMGVPVVTLRGNVHAARVSASILHRVGLDELVADSASQYLRIAIDLANDTARRQRLHMELRPRMTNSPLMHPTQVTREIEAAFESAALNKPPNIG